mmetsp:Transcript_40450/g.100031  ORF Transcript_40450/g.100031 Transcript_40450/m.100031 type:complete len:348 (-) Transcript_40450:161-1204(-)
MSTDSTSSSALMAFFSILGNFQICIPLMISRNLLTLGKSPRGSWYSCTIFSNSPSKLSNSFFCFSANPVSTGICLRRCATMSTCVRAARTRFTNSFTLRSQLRWGMSSRSLSRSACSFANSSAPSWLFSVLGGLSLNDPTYTLHTSGVMNTLPRLHISAPYTRISCCALTWSALLSTTRTLSSWPRRQLITLLNSSLMSSLCGSNSSRMTSERAANHSHTCTKLYPRSMRCFSPLSTPGVSTSVISSSSLALHWDASNLDRNDEPNAVRPVKGLSLCTARVCPGVTRGSWPCMTTTKRSVVGSGPMLHPGYSVPSRCLMNVVLPVLYCPSSSTLGLPSKSPSVSSGE